MAFPPPTPGLSGFIQMTRLHTEEQSNQFASGDIFLPFSCYSLDYQAPNFFFFRIVLVANIKVLLSA